MNSLIHDLREIIQHQFEQTVNTVVTIFDFKSIAGGCINSGGKLSTSAGDYFLKWNSATLYPGMFKKEALGLQLLNKSATVKIPNVVCLGENNEHQFLILEFIEPGRPHATNARDLGVGLANLHRNTSSSFGLDHDNYIGSLTQWNTQHDKWIDFFIEERLMPQIQLAFDKGAFRSGQFQNLFKRLPELLPEEPPALLHGDLWSGNVITDQKGNAVLIDPAIYYGHREVDLAFTQLFGGFSREFYDAYSNEYPLIPGFRQRVDLYNLYPLLVHVNLFGGSYAAQVNAILSRFV